MNKLSLIFNFKLLNRMGGGKSKEDPIKVKVIHGE